MSFCFSWYHSVQLNDTHVHGYKFTKLKTVNWIFWKKTPIILPQVYGNTSRRRPPNINYYCYDLTQQFGQKLSMLLAWCTHVYNTKASTYRKQKQLLV